MDGFVGNIYGYLVSSPLYHSMTIMTVFFSRQNQICIMQESCSLVCLKVHSYKILTIQQGLPRGISSVEIPWQLLTGFKDVWVRMVLDYCEVCKGLTKCWGSEIQFVVSSEFWKSAAKPRKKGARKGETPFRKSNMESWYPLLSWYE